jgi:hypothetical protein
MTTPMTQIWPQGNPARSLQEREQALDTPDHDLRAGLDLDWSWCARCRRVYPTGTYRIVRFGADRNHPHPKELHLCPYPGCSGSITKDRWRWESVRMQHAEFPDEPEPDVRYGDA